MYSMWNAPSSDDYYGQFAYGPDPELEDEQLEEEAFEAELEEQAELEVERQELEAAVAAEREADMAAYYAARERADFEEWVRMLEEDAEAHFASAY